MYKKYVKAIINKALVLLAAISYSVCAQTAGVLDIGFNGTGYITALPIGPNELAESGERLLIQPDGKILVAGQCDTLSNIPVVCLARLNPNGTLDTSFDGPDASGTGAGDGHGKFLLRLGAADTANLHPRIALQTDGKIVVAATCREAGVEKFCVARLQPDGRFDPSFGATDVPGTGVVVLPNPSDAVASRVRAIGMHIDGRISLAGECQLAASGRLAFCLMRIDGFGQLDPTFDGPDTTQEDVGQGNGQFVLPTLWSNSAGASGDETPTALAVQSDGTTLIAGFCESPPRRIACVVKLLPDGRFDPGFFDQNNAIRGRSLFGGGGYSPVFAMISSIALQPDYKIVVAGTCRDASNAGNRVMCVARLRRNGVIDALPSNASDRSGLLPLTTVVANESSQIDTVLLQPDGRVVAVGACRGEGGAALQRLCVTRITADETRYDRTFGGGGSSAARQNAVFDCERLFLSRRRRIAVGRKHRCRRAL